MFDASNVSDVLDFNTRVFPVRPVRPAVAGCTTSAPDTPTVMSISPDAPCSRLATALRINSERVSLFALAAFCNTTNSAGESLNDVSTPRRDVGSASTCSHSRGSRRCVYSLSASSRSSFLVLRFFIIGSPIPSDVFGLGRPPCHRTPSIRLPCLHDRDCPEPTAVVGADHLMRGRLSRHITSVLRRLLPHLEQPFNGESVVYMSYTIQVNARG